MDLDASPRDSPSSNGHSDFSSPSDLQQGCMSMITRHPSQLSPVRVYVTGLPSVVTTLDIYNAFIRFGEVVHIKIHESRYGDGSGRRSSAEIEFRKRPERDFWPCKIPFNTQNTTSIISVRLAKIQPNHTTIESPTNKGITYNVRIELLIEALHFGVLLEPHRMMTFTSCGTEHDRVTLVLDLRRKQIDIMFPSLVVSENSEAVRHFRFQVPLDEDFELWDIEGSSYILHLDRPPWYSKQLKERMDQTHTPGAKRWSTEDTWARQTDVVGHTNDIQIFSRRPVSLRKDGNCINIARWTTFKLDLVRSDANITANKILQGALRDFNITTLNGNEFEVTAGNGETDTAAWALLQGCSNATGNTNCPEEQMAGVLPFEIRYQLEVCLSHGWISEYSLTKDFLHTLSAVGPAKAKQALLHLDATRQREWYPPQLFKDLKYRQPVQFRELPEGSMEVRSATVTATGILFNSPTIEVTNRIMRKYQMYADHFLRVRFEDDKSRGQSKLYPSANNKMVQIFQRVRRVLRYGIRLGGLHYEFLAWSNSQLREHGAYFFAKAGSTSAESIRTEMGAFDKEKVVAKRAARMGQCFSTTRSVHLIVPPVTEATTIPDICKDKYNFTDGVGKISTFAAQTIHSQLDIKGPIPSAFQFRLGGCKGVLVVWPDMVGVDLKVRASQFKFSSSSNELEVIRWSEFWQPFLNRQLILCLSDLGIPDQVFLQMQDKIVESLAAAISSDAAALKALRDTVDPNSMTLSLCDLVEAGFRSSNEPFVMSLLHLWRASTLKYLKEKAKIHVQKGAFVLGCADETGKLRGHYNELVFEGKPAKETVPDLLPEIFLQISNPQSGQREIITGKCVLARNPSLHRGDIRVVMAVDEPALRHLCDVVVMPTNGDRDLPSMCSGGDLDGDDYVVIWDPDLIPEVWNAKPFHYNAPPAKAAVENVTTDDITNFFYDYLQNDCLGKIAHAHLAAADFLDNGIQDKDCEELVQLHSMAVDYPKTGVPAVMEARLERTKRPHFMEKGASRYHSRKILGQLYDAVEKVAFEPKYDGPFDETILSAYKPDEQLRAGITALKHDYDSAMQRVMARHDIRTEFEVFSTFVLAHSKASSEYKFHEEIGNLSRVLKEQYRHALVDLAGGSNHEKLAPVAVAAYQYTYAQVKVGLKEIEQDLRLEGHEGMPFISFPWLLQDTLCWLKARAKPQPKRCGEKQGLDDTEKDSDIEQNLHKVQEWLENVQDNSDPKTIQQCPQASEKPSASTHDDEAGGSSKETKGKETMPVVGKEDIDQATLSNMMADPLNVTIEQMLDMGFNEDIEIVDES